MAKANYYNCLLRPHEMDVLGKNEDGTYNIGVAGDKKKGTAEQLIVGSVQVSPDGKPKEGFITLGEEAKPEPKKEDQKK